VNKDVKQQTMADLFQEVFNPTNTEVAMLPLRSTGAGYHGRMQQIMQMEKDRHAEFLRQFNIEQGCMVDWWCSISCYEMYMILLVIAVIQRELLFRFCQGRWKES